MHRTIHICFLLPALALLGASQQPQPAKAHKSPPAPAPAHPEMMPMPLVAPLFVENSEFSSLVTVVNGAAATATADVLLLDQRGAQILKKTISLNGHSQEALKLSDLLQGANANVSVGSVEIMPETKAAQSMSVVAQLSIVSNSTSPPTYLEEEFLMPSSAGSNAYQAAASSVIGSPVPALMSTSANPQSVTITCLPEHGAGANPPHTLQLAAGQMTLASACDPVRDSSSAFEDAWHQTDWSSKGAVGLSITTSGKSGDLAVYGFAARGERNHPAYTALNFIDPGMLRSSNTVFAGVPVGEEDLLPGKTYKPEIAISNFGTQPAPVSVLYATTDATRTNSNTLASATVPPRTSRSIELPSLTGDASMRNSFIIQSTAATGTLAANLISVDKSTSTTVQLIGKDQKQAPNSGAHPWTIADRTNSTLLLLNHSDADQSFDVNITAEGVLWQQEYKLAAKETKSLSINDLIANGVKDKKGNVIPKDATTGEVGWSAPKSSNGVGRLLVSRPDISLARSFSCGTQDVPCGLEFAAYALDIAVGGLGTLGPVTTDYCMTCWPSCGDCTGTYDYNGGGDAVSWSSYDTSIATVDGNGNITGQSQGQTIIEGTGYDPACLVQAGNASVGPDHMVVKNDQVVTCDGCSTTVARLTTYQVQFKSNDPLWQIAICENPSNSNWSCTQNQPSISYNACGTNNASTDGNGEFTDKWSLGTDNLTPAGCGIDSTDTWMQYIEPTGRVPFGTLKGYLHTDAIKINGYAAPPNNGLMPNNLVIRP